MKEQVIEYINDILDSDLLCVKYDGKKYHIKMIFDHPKNLYFDIESMATLVLKTYIKLRLEKFFTSEQIRELFKIDV
jgi:hypothetical protein